MNRIGMTALAVMVPMLLSSCSEVNRSQAPVRLIVTHDQALQQIDLLNSAGCDRTVGTILLQVVPLQDQQNNNIPTDNRLNDVEITRYTVSYTRTDGGTQVPAPFTRNMSQIIGFSQAASSFSTFLLFEPNALNQAPFAALLPVNGGRDPQTGKGFVKLDIQVQVFGHTLAGEDVSGTTHIPLDFCYDCGGCF